jgi:Arc/MetJ-type ribon-helix-helix transcriptional regulator
MTAEPVPSPSTPDKAPEDDVGDTAELWRASLDRAPAGLIDLIRNSPEFREALVRQAIESPVDPTRPLRLVGKARKVSVSMPEDLTAAVQQRVGRGEFSSYVTDAVSRQLELDLLADLLALLEAEHGPIPEEALIEARSLWPDA